MSKIAVEIENIIRASWLDWDKTQDPEGWMDLEAQMTAEKIEAEILAAQWIDGPPKDTDKGKFVLRFKNGIKGDLNIDIIWDAKECSLKKCKGDHGLMQFDDSLIKHMELPDYE